MQLRRFRLSIVGVLGVFGVVASCTYDFDQFEGLSPPEDAGPQATGGSAGHGGATTTGAGGGSGAASDASSDRDATADRGTSEAGGSGGTAGSAGSGGRAIDASVDGGGGASGTSGSGGNGTAGSGAAGSGPTGGGGSGGTGAAGAGGSTGGAAGSGGSGPTGGAAGSGGSGATGGTGATGGSGGTSGSSGAGGTSGSDGGPVDARNDAADACTARGGVIYAAHCYYVVKTAANFQNARQTSCAGSAHLVTIASEGEQTAVNSLLSNDECWIGMRRPNNSNKVESSYGWITSDAVTFTNWEVYGPGDKEPNYTGECVRARTTGKWGDIQCTDMLAAVCEID